MDATTPLDVDVPFYFQFYDPTTGLPDAPSPAPTVSIVRLVDDAQTTLVAPGTALTAVSGATGRYAYVLDAGDNDADGVLIGTATTTDAAYTPYFDYANVFYTVQAGAGGGASAADNWAYPEADATVPGSMGEFIVTNLNAIRIAADKIVLNGVVFVRAPVDANGNTTLQQGVGYLGAYRLQYLVSTTRDLSLLSAADVRLQFRANNQYAPQNSFPADEITGSVGAWTIYVPITNAQSAALTVGSYAGQLAVYEGGLETPNIGSFTVKVESNP